jgi:hypothetical protein
MREVIVATPLKYSTVTRPHIFAQGKIEIRELKPILTDRGLYKMTFADRDKDMVKNTTWWLTASALYPYVGADTGDELYDVVRQAAWALQIICPSGASHIFMKFAKEADGWDNIGNQIPRELCSTLIGRVVSAEDQGLLRDFDAVYAGVRQAWADKCVRIQNPILLIEHGMQVCNPPLGILMFVMGLDMLFMAGKINPFVGRVAGFLGLNSFIFPPITLLNYQPTPTVGNVIADVYKYRNLIAHGSEIPASPYRSLYNLMSICGKQINVDAYSYEMLMLEASLFLLTRSLRQIFVQGRYPQVKDVGEWRLQTTIFEHRFKNDGGIDPEKNTGR